MMRSAARLAIAAVFSSGCAVTFAQDGGSRYAELMADSESLSSYNEHVESQLQSQQNRIGVLQKQISGLDATAAEFNGLVTRMYQELETFVAADLPFIDPVSDRNERMERLRSLMEDEGANPSERYRRVLEAYQIEIEYGRNMESYASKLEDGREAEFVRVGRVALLYRTADGKETGYWDMAQKKWVVDNSYVSAVIEALRMAKKEVAPDLIAVPVPAPQEVRS